MNSNDDCRTYVEHMRTEHAHIDQALMELQNLLSQAAQSREGDHSLLARLVKLRDDLRHHFRDEEEGGCLEEAQSKLPGLSEGVRKLQTEHATFLSSLDAMISKAEKLAGQSATIRDLQSAFGDFLRRLHAHETEENRILLLGFGSPAMDTLST